MLERVFGAVAELQVRQESRLSIRSNAAITKPMGLHAPTGADGGCCLDLIRFRKGERKHDRTQDFLRQWRGGEGVLYIGKAQEKARVLRTQASSDPVTGLRSTRLVSSTAMPNAYYFYVVDEDFGPLVVKFCSCLPLQRQALSQRPRVRQAPAAAGEHRLRGAQGSSTEKSYILARTAVQRTAEVDNRERAIYYLVAD